MQANREIHYVSEKSPIYMPRSKAPETQQNCCYRHTRKPVELLNDMAQASTLASAIILLTWAPLQKFLSCSIDSSLA